jgi:multicomponent Na+:H+ antiporter subunit E
MLLLNVLLALAWAVLVSQVDLPNLIFGFGLGAVMLYLARNQLGGANEYFRKMRRVVQFVGYVLWEIVLANVQVARAVLFTPVAKLRPGIVAVPLDLETDAEITMLANLITLTPGTLSLEVSDDRKTLFVHAIAVGDAEAFRAATKSGFEHAVREVFS